MDKYCINTDSIMLTDKCTKDCVHRFSGSPTGCIQQIYDRPLTAHDIAHFDKISIVEMRRKISRAENKLTAWGKVLDSLDSATLSPFSAYIENMAFTAPELATQISEDLNVYIIDPMKYVKSDMWRSIVATHRHSLQECGLVGNRVFDTWCEIERYGLL